MLTTLVPYLALLAVCSVAGGIDIRTGRVFNTLTYPAMLAGLLFWAVIGVSTGEPLDPLKASATAMCVGLVPMAVIVLMGGLGGGDMKLMGAVGAISASWQVVVATGLYALVIAALIAVGVMIRRGIVKRTLGRLFAAAVMAGSRVKPEMPTDSPKVPFAVGIAIGAAVAGAEHFFGLRTPFSPF